MPFAGFASQRLLDRALRYGYLADGRLAWRRNWSNDTLRCYDYDVFGALRRFREGAISASVTESPCSEIDVQTEVAYDIDPAGRRVGRTQRGYTGGVPATANVRRWIYADALNPVAQLDQNNRITQAYVYGNYAHTPDYLVAFSYADAESTSPSSTTTYRYVYDIRGSVRLVVNASTGVIAQQLDYGPWGEVLDDSAPGFQPFGYAGGEYDATTDLVRFGARDYDAEIGRWTAKDPIGFAGGDTNLYAYVGGDPIGLVDVTGLLVYVCREPFLFLGMTFDHWWLEVDGVSMGYGADDAGSHWTRNWHQWRMADLSILPRRIMNSDSAMCDEISGLSPEQRNCLLDGMTCGRSNDPGCPVRAWTPLTPFVGHYFPFYNDCQSAVLNLLSECL
jgi:RHS repeat-associated protein